MTNPLSNKAALIQTLKFEDHFDANSWSEYNRAFFDKLAPKYDWLNEIITLGQQRTYKRRLVERAQLAANAHVLDLCTGSGDLALLIAQRYPQARVTGADVSTAMLKIARKKCSACPNVSFREEDALALSFKNNSFDAVFIGFGLRNFTDMAQGLHEIRRVLKPGGIFVNLDLNKPENGIRRLLHRFYFENVMPWMGKHLFHRGEFNSLAYLPASNQDFPTADQLIVIFKEMGFGRIRRYDHLLGGISQQFAIKIA